jgi:predicted Zn-ribbon and HTH transcriptional regulator
MAHFRALFESESDPLSCRSSTTVATRLESRQRRLVARPRAALTCGFTDVNQQVYDQIGCPVAGAKELPADGNYNKAH